MIPLGPLLGEIGRHPYPLLFATLSGAHLYGFPSPDSDFDLRGVHLLPAAEVIGLYAPQDTIQVEGVRDGLDLDLVTHDAAKFFRLLLRPNGYVLEQLYSPLIVSATPEHAELCTIGRGCITRRHAHHYLGFAATQWRLFEKEEPPRVKPLLYLYRVLLTGIHLLRTGQVESNLVQLNEEFRLPYLPELVDRKQSGPERGTLSQTDRSVHLAEYARLRAELEQAVERSPLPEEPTAKRALNDLLVRLRLEPKKSGKGV